MSENHSHNSVASSNLNTGLTVQSKKSDKRNSRSGSNEAPFRNAQNSFASATTDESLTLSENQLSVTDRKSKNSQNQAKLLPTKQFSADFDLDSEDYSLRMSPSKLKLQSRKKLGYKLSPPPRTIFPCGKLSLERQPSGNLIDFDIYENADLPFLDKNTEVGKMVSKNIVQSTLDDDVMTDDEMIQCANRILKNEVQKAIKMFNSGFDRSTQIRNMKL